MNDNLNDVKSEWLQARACRGVPTETFFPEGSGNREKTWAIARSICAECPVLEQCRTFCDLYESAPDARVFGMWAGETPNERKYRRYLTQNFLTGTHGTRTMWTRGCRCQPCVTANYQRVSSYKKKETK